MQFDLPAIRTPEDIPATLDSVLQAYSRGALTLADAASPCGLIVDNSAKVLADVGVYLNTVRKLAGAKDKAGLQQLKAPY